MAASVQDHGLAGLRKGKVGNWPGRGIVEDPLLPKVTDLWLSAYVRACSRERAVPWYTSHHGHNHAVPTCGPSRAGADRSIGMEGLSSPVAGAVATLTRVRRCADTGRPTTGSERLRSELHDTVLFRSRSAYDLHHVASGR